MSQKTQTIRTYTELIKLPTFIERFRYLRLTGAVGVDTFGFDRYLNQFLYRSEDWKRLRREVILRDNGCDLAIPDRYITGRLIVHHLNPLTIDDVKNRSDFVLNPEYLVCVSHITHNAIHYGDEDLLTQDPIERKKNDTCPWRQ